MISEFEILRDLDRRLATLQNTTDNNLGSIRSEFRQFRVERHYLIGDLKRDMREICRRLDGLEEKASKPIIDWQPILQNLWFKIAVLLALATGNTQLIELVTATFQK